MITRHVKDYSVSSISVHFITYKRVAKGFRLLSVKPYSVNFLKSLAALKEVKFPIVFLLS